MNENWFMSMEYARCKIEAWRIHYNQSRPHSALGWMTHPNSPKNLPVAKISNQPEAGYS